MATSSSTCPLHCCITTPYRNILFSSLQGPQSTTALTLLNFSFKVVFLSLSWAETSVSCRTQPLNNHLVLWSSTSTFSTLKRCTPPGRDSKANRVSSTAPPFVCAPALPYFQGVRGSPLLISSAYLHLKVPPQQSSTTLRPSQFTKVKHHPYYE